MSSSIKDTVQRYGLTEVYCASDPQVDVVLVHGLNGDPYNTWATHKPEVFWPTDLLPEFVKDQHCRILTYGYDSKVTTFTDGASTDHIHNQAEHLAARLVANRSVKARERPIIFVVHSLGGLVVKRLLIYCESINNPKLERLRSIYVSTFGILFLGTPHNGSDLAKWGSLLQSICSAVMPKKLLDSSPQLVDSLKKNNETLQNINRLFVEIIEPIRLYFFHEMKPTDLKGTRQFIVDEDSAAPVMQGVERMGIEKDHSTMCKFESVKAPGFDVVSDAISSYAEEAPAKVRNRWEREKRVREYYRQSMASELLDVGDSILPSYSQPQSSLNSARESPRASMENSTQSVQLLLEAASSHSSQKQPRVAPLLFRPNSVFEGFDIEFSRLKYKLSKEKRENVGTRSVIISGPPGSGKSHLARQYVWTSEDEYPAGIFWVDCKSRQNRDRYYWDIGQALGCLEGDVSQNDRSFVQEVRKRLESLEGWLLVFDGIFFDSDDQLNEFVTYLPDRTGNSIIYTSVDPTLKNRHRLLNPALIKVHPLNNRAACKLLFKSLGLRTYTTTQERKAQELVRYYGYLPLGIHAAAHMLIAQGRALEKFSPSTSDQRLVSAFVEIVQALERRGYTQAVALLVLLCFLNHQVPVTLLKFGIPLLVEVERDVRSTDRAGGVRNDLDNTISVLLRYGLVERELQTYSVSSPKRKTTSPEISRATTAASVAYSSPTIPNLTQEESSNLRLMTNEDDRESGESISRAIDTLRIHTVTQIVLRQEIKDFGIQGLLYNDWLVLACQFLCFSFRTASLKLRSLPGQGSVSDYCQYKSHISHLGRLLPKTQADDVSPLGIARKELRVIYHEIQDEIRARSPSQSQSSKAEQFKYFGSVFETSGSSSDEGPYTPTGRLSRELTWSSEKDDTQTESPVHYQMPDHAYQNDNFSDIDDDGYATEVDDFHSNVRSSQRWSTTSGDTAAQSQLTEHSPRQGLLHAILKGHGIPSREQSLADLAIPTVGKISNPEIETMRPRSSSVSSSNFPWPFRRTTTSSTAELALNAVRAKSPVVKTTAVENRKASTGSDSIQRKQIDMVRQALSPKSTNTNLPSVGSNYGPELADHANKPQDLRPAVRNPSTSPRLAQTVLARQAARVWEDLPIEESITITRRYPARGNAAAAVLPHNSFDGTELHPTGYRSVPMSRDTSRESNNSLLSAPAGAMPIPINSDPAFSGSYEYSNRGMPSIDLTMARSLDLHSTGGWAPTSPFGLEDDIHDLERSGQIVRTAPPSVPLSPILGSLEPDHVGEGTSEAETQDPQHPRHDG